MLDVTLRTISISLFIGRYIYWIVEQKRSEKILPKIKRSLSWYELTSKYVYIAIQVLIVLQLLGLPLYQLPNNSIFQLVGFVLLIIGVGIDIFARKEIGNNWTSGEEYQIKENQKLITTGIYKYIRHPIYTGFALSFIGAEMVAGSWLFVAFFAYFISSYVQGKREEKILLGHFGEKYKDYMKKTKMLIPWIW